MTTGLISAPLALLLFCAHAGARPPESAVDVDALAREVQQAPTSTRTIERRLRTLTAALERSSTPLPTAHAMRIKRIREMLGEGARTPAAREFDELVGGMNRPPAVAPSAASGEGLRGEVPTLLSRPARHVAAPIPGDAPPGGAVFVRPFAAQESGHSLPSWQIFAAIVGGVFLMGLSTLMPKATAARRDRDSLETAHPGAGRPVAAKTAPASAPPPPPTPAPAPAPAAPKAGPGAAALPAALSEKYTLGKSIASGGMGEVYEGRDIKLGRRVAIKRMLADVKLDKELRALFLKEARTVAKLTHPFIVQIHDCVENGEELYLVFEFVEGETLSQRLMREARLPLKECRRIFGYVCEAIEHAHKNHVLHRDIKPANIMIDKNGIARVMDFGIALESTRTLSKASNAELDIAGTPRYMPPEQHYGRSVRASDIYAMGVCLYEMATGHTPFSASNHDELLEQKRARRFPQATTLAPGLGKEFDVLIGAALAPDPGSRISSAAEFLEALDSVLAHASDRTA